ncbi:DNA-directed RNA polymerase subunit alpha [Candidatus Peregrinibacteria bacterium]|jgi:DNA-directed RNA polymerase subunit alpha|nr:DNA-directed RNA polymerase subunit alpha [Candidatus Peregrinibacteria bacterium]
MHQIQEEIGVPKITPIKSDGNRATFEIGPLPTGYGMTLGNALRRVLISSLPGAAVAAVKVNGVAHEYSTLSGVKDSVLDMILNIKLLHVKKESSEPSILTLNVNKKGVVKAKDIKTPSDVEVMNPDLYITTLDDKAKLEMEITIEKGVGYIPVSERNKKEDPFLIWVDTIFSPVKKVKYDVEAARVGQMTNLDKLIIEVETSGSMSPEDSLKFAANILKSYFDLFDNSEVPVEAEFMSDLQSIANKQKEAEAQKPAQEKYTPIEILGLSPRTLNSLINGGIGSIEQLTKCTEAKLTNLRGFGKKALTEVAAALESRDLKLDDES